MRGRGEKGVDQGGADSKVLIEALEKVLAVNLARLKRLEVDPSRQIADSTILTFPIESLREQSGGILATAVLERAMRRGYFEDAQRFFESSPKAPDALLNVGLNIFTTLHFSRREGEKDIVPTLVSCMEVATKLPRKEHFLGGAYLQSIMVSDSESIDGVKIHAEALERYIHGLLEAGEREPENGVFAICCVEGGLRLYPELAEDLLKVYRATGFLRIDRLQSEPQPGENRDFQVQRGAVGARVRELAAFVEDPTFRAHSRIASLVFVGREEKVCAGPIVEQLEENGYMIVPSSAKSNEEIAEACARTKSLAGRPSDLVVVVGDFRGLELPSDLGNGVAPSAQFLFVGERLGESGGLSARSANLLTGRDSFGSSAGAHGAELQFDSDYRLAGVKFLRRAFPQVSLPGERSEASPGVETVRYPARK